MLTDDARRYGMTSVDFFAAQGTWARSRSTPPKAEKTPSRPDFIREIILSRSLLRSCGGLKASSILSRPANALRVPACPDFCDRAQAPQSFLYFFATLAFPDQYPRESGDSAEGCHGSLISITGALFMYFRPKNQVMRRQVDALVPCRTQNFYESACGYCSALFPAADCRRITPDCPCHRPPAAEKPRYPLRRHQMDTSGKGLKGALFWEFSCYIND